MVVVNGICCSRIVSHMSQGVRTEGLLGDGLVGRNADISHSCMHACLLGEGPRSRDEKEEEDVGNQVTV
jgi:hypothetical protein